MLTALICVVFLLQSAIPVGAHAADTFSITVNGDNIELMCPAQRVNGIYMLPFKELMSKMGFFVIYNAEENAYTGDINGVEAIVPLDSDKACYDAVWIELENSTVSLDSDVLTELEFIDKLYGIDYTCTDDGISFTVKKSEQKEIDEENISIDEYLATLTPKSIVVKNEDLFNAELSDPELVAMREVEVDGAPGFTKAVEVENLTEPQLYYRSQITINTTESVSAGDVLVATFYARKIKCVDESGFSKFNSTFEALDVDWTKFHNVTAEVADDWTRFQYPFVVTKDLKNAGAHFCLRVGFRYQTIQFGGVEVVNYGKKADISVMAPDKVVETTYYGREDGALWREEAFKRIEKYRKNDITVKVKDADGNPIKNAKVSADMTKSEFLWGTAVTETRAFESARTSVFYDDILSNKFNSMTLESNMKPAGFRLNRCVKAINYARDNDMYFRAHAILWDSKTHYPSEINEESSVEEVLDFSKRYASKLIYNFGDSITEMDVLNEPLNNSTFRDKYGSDFIVELFKSIKDMAPDIKLFVNDVGMIGLDSNLPSSVKFKGIVDDLVSKGAPVDGIAMQNHAAGFIYPQNFYNQLDYMAENVDYIAVTEYDYLSKLPENEEALAVEADYLRDSVIMAYSHPKMTSFTMWGFGDLGHWRKNAPLYFENYTPKPALKYWDEYVWGEWFTKESIVTDENGEAVIRGHRGNYDITVECDGKEAKTTLVLTKNGENCVNAVVDVGGISLSSSHEVPEKLPKLSMQKVILNEKASENEYKKLYENKAISALRSSGEKADFLFDKDNTSLCALDKEDYIILNLAAPLNSGYITLETAGENEALFKAEVSTDDGSWHTVYSGETSAGKGNCSFEQDGVKQIKISGLIDIPAMIRYLKVAEKEENHQ